MDDPVWVNPDKVRVERGVIHLRKGSPFGTMGCPRSWWRSGIMCAASSSLGSGNLEIAPRPP